VSDAATISEESRKDAAPLARLLWEAVCRQRQCGGVGFNVVFPGVELHFRVTDGPEGTLDFNVVGRVNPAVKE
jgi:hypothetical protein